MVLNGQHTLGLFLETLGTITRESYDDMVRAINKKNQGEGEEGDLERDPFDKSFSRAMEAFILHIAEDP